MAPRPIVDRAAPQAHAGSSSTAGRGLVDLLAVLGALAVGFGMAWTIRQRGPRLPEGLQRVDAASPFHPGPALSEGAAVFEAQDPRAFLPVLLEGLLRSRPVVLVLPDDAVDMALVASTGEPLYRTSARDWEEVDRHVRALVKTSGRTPAVVVLGRDTLVAPGAVADDPPVRLVEALPQGVFLGLLVEPESPPVGFLQPWRAELDGEQGWQLSQETSA